MAKLTAKARKNIPAGKFGLPGKNGKPGKYPEEDKGHAIAAESRATQNLATGKLTPAQANKIKHKAAMVLGKGDCSYHNC